MGENELDLGFQPTLNIGGGNKGEDNTKPNEEITHLNGKGDPTNPEDVTGKDGTKPGEQPIIEDSNKGEEEKKGGSRS